MATRRKRYGRDTKRLTAKKRQALRPSQFALPARRALPIEDAAHVRNAAARLAQMRKRGTVTEREYRSALSKISKAEKTYGIRSRASRDPIRVCPVGTKIQSVIVDKSYFDRRDAIGWIKRHGFKNQKLDETTNTFRFRQDEPNRFEADDFRVIRLRPGVEAVIGCPR